MKPPGPLDQVVPPHHAGQSREDPLQHPDKQAVKVNKISRIFRNRTHDKFNNNSFVCEIENYIRTIICIGFTT